MIAALQAGVTVFNHASLLKKLYIKIKQLNPTLSFPSKNKNLDMVRDHSVCVINNLCCLQFQ